MSASTIDPAVTRLSNPALISDANAKVQIFGFVPARNFRVDIGLEDSTAVNPVIDLASAVVDWKFTPVDPDDYAEDEVHEEYYGDDASDDLEDDPDMEDIELDDELDEDDEDSAPADLLGFLDLTFLLSRDTMIQAALMRESACINATVNIHDANGAPLAVHSFVGFIYQEDIQPVGSSDSYNVDGVAYMTASVRIRIFDCTLWGLA